MARTAAVTANILSDLYDETFGRDSFEPFRITWPQLRSLAAVPRLNDNYLNDISVALSETERTLIPFNEYLLVVSEQDFSHYRMVPDRLLEQYLPDARQADGKDIELDDDDYTIN